MKKKLKFGSIAVIILGFLGVSFWYLHHTNIPVLEPAGPVGLKERNLIYFALGLSLLVVIPVFTLLISFAYRYRESNTKAKYSPKLDGNRFAELTWWLIPSMIILVLAIVAWNSSHTLDPYRSLVSKNKTITIQVVALDWRWLFIYPNQGVASVNYFKIPLNTPVDFEITSDAVMNSFWIPQLGGQIYAMPGMSTNLNLMASKSGIFNGLSANISGKGFSDMNFKVQSTSSSDYTAWLKMLGTSKDQLSLDSYNKLSSPSLNTSVLHFSSVASDLYLSIINKYMSPNTPIGTMSGMVMR